MNERVASPCWTAQNARAVLVTEALSGDDALFLATHAPLKDFGVEGTHASDITETSEHGLLSALSNPELEHAFCVVQGDPGSGKSHLIRWLHVNWPVDDLVLLIQRADGSLDGTLRQLKARLPDEFGHLFDRLGQQQVAGLAGRAFDFLLALGASLDAGYFEVAPVDAAWCRDYDPMRVDLARHCTNVHDSVASHQLARRLVREADLIRAAREEGRSWDEIEAGGAGPVAASRHLVAALNRRLNHAVQRVIGISAEGLKRLFEDLRVALGSRGRRMVLLLEDVTSWQGLDDSLVDALVTDATTRPEADLCPLISVVGVTSDYYGRLAGNYRQRITHNIGLGDSTGRFEDVASLRNREDRSAFVAGYLSAVRAGREDLAQWREAFRSDHRIDPPNPCLPCLRREACHGSFGEVDGIGLFPFTSDAIEGFFSALKVDDGGMTHRTPRGILQGVLTPTLLNPAVLDRGEYPGPEIETAIVEKRQLSSVLTRRLETRIAEPVERQRYRRLLTYWGTIVRKAFGMPKATSATPA